MSQQVTVLPVNARVCDNNNNNTGLNQVALFCGELTFETLVVDMLMHGEHAGVPRMEAAVRLLLCGPWSMLLTFPFRVLLRLLRKPENGNLWWSRISEQLVEELVKLPTLRLNASVLARIV